MIYDLFLVALKSFTVVTLRAYMVELLDTPRNETKVYFTLLPNKPLAKSAQSSVFNKEAFYCFCKMFQF